MKIYSIFDDFDEQAVKTIVEKGHELTIHPIGVPRPDHDQMKEILEKYDCVIIGTSQKITEDMFEKIRSPKLIATASVGLDHIRIPEEKRELVTIINTPKANARSVAEYTFGCALCCVKRLTEGCDLFRAGKSNKSLRRKPEDLAGKTLGVIGAGNISVKILEMGRLFGMKFLCWTRDPKKHSELIENGIRFVDIGELCSASDIISVNLPNNNGTAGIISGDLISLMKDSAVFISVSRKNTVDLDALFKKAEACPNFYLCLDLDVDPDVTAKLPELPNILVTPHIAGGTAETRKRMFRELADEIEPCSIV